MYKLTNKETNQEIGSIDENQLKFLMDQLEEESADDKDYWIHSDSLDTFRENGGDAALMSILEKAIGTNDHLEVSIEKVG